MFGFPNEIRIVHDGKEFFWTRFNDGEGHWFYQNCVTSLVLDSELTEVARGQGITEKYDFSRLPPKPKKEKEPTVRVRQRRPGSKTAVRIRL